MNEHLERTVRTFAAVAERPKRYKGICFDEIQNVSFPTTTQHHNGPTLTPTSQLLTKCRTHLCLALLHIFLTTPLGIHRFLVIHGP